MRVPLLDLKRQYEVIGKELEETACRVLASGGYILGSEVSSFEEEAAQYVGTQHAIGVSSGTDALLCALMALDVGPGDEVICPTYTFFATAGCVARLGAKPVFVDCDEDTLNSTANAVQAALSPKTKAVIAVHLFGRAADVEAMRAILDPKGIPLVEGRGPGDRQPATRQALRLARPGRLLLVLPFQEPRRMRRRRPDHDRRQRAARPHP
jgi:UDP-2-acetamido-2-deoxy-ribo-hexuluronate aminotransferase